MKERNVRWIAATLLVALLIIEEANTINGQNITSEDKLSTKKAGMSWVLKFKDKLICKIRIFHDFVK